MPVPGKSQHPNVGVLMANSHLDKEGTKEVRGAEK